MADDFKLANLSSSEMDARLAAAATVYGTNTRSYNASSEKRESKAQQKAVTAKYEAAPRQEVIVGPICSCRSFPLPHELKEHRSLKTEHDWKPWEERYVFDKEYNCWVLKVQRFQERVS